MSLVRDCLAEQGGWRDELRTSKTHPRLGKKVKIKPKEASFSGDYSGGNSKRQVSIYDMSRRNFRNQSSRPPRREDRNAQRSQTPRGGQSRGSQTRASHASDDLVMGRNCVTELIRHSPGRLREVFLSEVRDDSRSAGNDRRRSLLDEVERLGIPFREVSRKDLDSMVQSDSHQGVVARVSPRPALEFDALVQMVREGQSARILALDGVLDPQNFGAMLRAAECFGVTAVLWSKNRGAPLGPVVSKVSVGGSELVRLCPVSNLHRALEALKEAGAWSVGAMVAPDATPLERFEFPEKCVLVMGSEGEGVQHLIEKTLDFRLYIPMCGQIDSLNVSQATAVLLHAVSNQHRQKDLLKVT